MTKVVILYLLTILSLIAQEHSTGLLIDDKSLENSAKSAPLMRGDYSNLPTSVSLKKHTPTPGDQGSFGTCTGWSTAYSARTILESINHNWNKQSIDSNTFSPSYIYNQIRQTDDCYEGASIVDALDILKEQGVLKFNDFGYDCDRGVVEADRKAARINTIIEYREVLDRYTKAKVEKVKKSLSEMKPVVIGMDCPKSFHSSKGLWKPKLSDYKKWGTGHALTVVGYDDEKYGGAFELMNSWGTEWGKNGYAWIKYEDFQYFCLLAFELISKEYDRESQYDLSGSLQFSTSEKVPMRCKLNDKIFVMETSYYSGTLFSLHISNNQPAYVYSFGTDLTNKTYQIFPFHDKMLAYLPYKENNIAIPDEDSFTMLDENSGTSYYCFLYSKEKLDIAKILETFEKNDEPILDNLNFVLGDKIIAQSEIIYTDGESISFKSKSGEQSILAVVVAFDHQ